jgi:hypothetical protein
VDRRVRRWTDGQQIDQLPIVSKEIQSMDEQVTPNRLESQPDAFCQAIDSARAIKEEYIQPRINWYKTHTRMPRWWFRGTGILTILLSVTLPAIAASNYWRKDIVLSVMSIAIAALTGLSSFYRWERTWRGNSSAQVALEQHCAKWELEMTNARLILAPEDRVMHVYQATDDLLTNASNVVSSESEGFFSGLQFPRQDSTTKG